MIVSPEVIAEQVMGYVVGATEMIPTLTPPVQPYTIAILPQGPHFYTGLLQAAGYLLLDGQKKKMLLISEQSDDEKNILINTTIYGTILGKIWKTSTKTLSDIKAGTGGIYSTKAHQNLIDNLYFQFPFLQVITKQKESIHIGLGKKTGSKQINALTNWIKKNIQEYNIVLLTNIEIPPSTKLKKTNEHMQIEKYIQTAKSPLFTLFNEINNLQKKKPQIIAYVNPGDFAKNKSLYTRYVCAVG